MRFTNTIVPILTVAAVAFGAALPETNLEESALSHSPPKSDFLQVTPYLQSDWQGSSKTWDIKVGTCSKLYRITRKCSAANKVFRECMR